MAYSPRTMARLARSRRLRASAVPLVLVMVAAVMAFTVLPAEAGNGSPSALGVQPVQMQLGGQPDDCSASVAGRLPSAASYELRIENPQNGTYNGPGGISITLAITTDDKHLDFDVVGAAVVYDVVIKGGQKSTHFDYDGNGGPGGTISDQLLHAPTKGGGQNLYQISHLSFCYEDVVPVSGMIYVDANQNGALDDGELADAPRVITAYSPASTAITTSALDGSYTLYLEPGGAYTICEEEITDFVQTAPAGTACNDLGTSEPGGHTLANLATQNNLNFGNVPEICGQVLIVDGIVFDAVFELFNQGNDETGCNNKIGQLFESDENGTPQLNLPLSGDGEVAGIGVITKAFVDTNFVPLKYAQSPTDTFEVLPWCGSRTKGGNDGDQFDPYLDDDVMYPSLAGIFNPISGAPSVSCKVDETENIEGTQTTVVLIQDDPFWQ